MIISNTPHATTRLAAAVALAVISSPSFGSAPAPLKMVTPTSPWVVDYGDQTCSLRRSFGAGNEAVTLQFEESSPRAPYLGQVWGAGAGAFMNGNTFGIGLGSSLRLTGNVLMRRADADRVHRIFFRMGDAGETKAKPPQQTNRSGSIYAADTARNKQQLRAADYFEFDVLRPVRLVTASMAPAIAALDACTDDLVRKWGLDPVAQRALATPPMPRTYPATWVTPDDFPTQALTDGIQGIVNFRVLVAADGKISGCVVQSGVSLDRFQAVVCRNILSRAKFFPAIDAAGKPVASYYADRTVFSIPD